MNINIKEINNITHEQLLKMHGKKITCYLEGKYIDDAIISVKNEVVYVCQNIKDGASCIEKFGYKYSWIISSDFDFYENYNKGCTNIKLVDEDLKIHKPSSDIADCIAYSFKDIDLDKAIDDITPNEYKQKQFKNKLNDVLKSIELLLTEKNRKYGNSALEPINIFSKLDKIEQLKISIDHKLKRIQNQQQDDIEDSVDDLIGYLLLLKIAKKENDE